MTFWDIDTLVASEVDKYLSNKFVGQEAVSGPHATS